MCLEWLIIILKLRNHKNNANHAIHWIPDNTANYPDIIIIVCSWYSFFANSQADVSLLIAHVGTSFNFDASFATNYLPYLCDNDW